MSFWKKFSAALHRMNYPDVAASKAAHPSNYKRPMVTDKTLQEHIDELNRVLGEPREDHSRDHMYGNGRGGYRVPHHPVIDEPTHPDDFTSLDHEARELCSLGESWSADAPKMAGVSQPEEEPDDDDLPHGGADLLDPDEDYNPEDPFDFLDEDEDDVFYYEDYDDYDEDEDDEEDDK